MGAVGNIAVGVVAGLALWADAASAQTFTRLSDSAPIAADLAGAALADGPVSLDLAAGGSAEVLGSRVTSRRGGTAYVAVSAEYLTFADLSGDLQVGRVRLAPGQAAVVTLATGRVERFEFDAARFIASAPPALAGQAQARLQPVAARQRQRLFWGLLSPTGVNARAPGSAAIESVRETWLMYPALLDIRTRAAGDRATARRLTAGRFVQALADKDAATLASLMDPEPFLTAGPAWTDVRLDFARRLTDGALPGQLAGADVAPEGEGFSVSSGGGSAWRLALVEHDGVAFISRLEPR